MKSWVVICLGLAAFLVVTTSGCESEPEPEEQARIIYENAKKLREEGRMLEAMEEYDKLDAFKATQTYNEANQTLIKEGISIGWATTSHTNKELFDLKNQLLQDKKIDYPDGTVMRIPKQDLWGSFYQVDYSSKGKYIFRILSLGPDKIAETDDDVYLFYGEHMPTEPKTVVAPTEASQARERFVQGELDSAKGSPPEQEEKPKPQTAVDSGADKSPEQPPGQQVEPELKIKRDPDGRPVVDLNDLLKK